jgi:hypothetical protein
VAKAAAKTGISPTVLIAIEQYFPEKQRIVEDDLAYHNCHSAREYYYGWRSPIGSEAS